MKPRKVKCRNCGREFETYAPRACYCCDQCALEGAKERRREWNERHPTYNHDIYILRKYEKKNRGLTKK